MDFTTYIAPELLVLVPALYFIGYCLKKNPKISDTNIPTILCVVGVILAFIWILGTTPLDSTQAIGTAIFMSITQGILVAAVAVLGNQIIKQNEKASEADGEEAILLEEYVDIVKDIVRDVVAETPSITEETPLEVTEEVKKEEEHSEVVTE